jgi:hypothetical protein
MRVRLIRGFDDEVTLGLGNHILLDLVPPVLGGVGRRHVLHHLDEVQLLGGLDHFGAGAATRQQAVGASGPLQIWRRGLDKR